MRRLLRFSVPVLLTAFLAGCDSLSELFETEDDSGVALVVSVESLTGKAVEFNSPENAAQTGGQPVWQYSFVEPGRLIGCNADASYQATDWFPSGASTIRVAFGAQWEEYEFVSGSWSEGGTFNYSNSVGLSASGTFREVPGLTLAGCP